jgi:predicted permease
VARLKDGVTPQAAQAELTAIAQRLAAAYPETNRGAGIRVVPLDEEITGRNTRLALWVLFGAVVLVVCIACANIANLLLARGGTRRREIALRAALGAPRSRIVRQFLTESVLLALLAGFAGLAVASASIPVLLSMAPSGIRRISEAQIDAPVFLFAFLVSLLAGVLFGAAPAIRFSRSNLNLSLRGGGHGSTSGADAGWGRHVLIVVETSLAMILLAGAGLLLRSFQAVSAVDPGFRADRVLGMGMSVTRDIPGDRTVAIFEEAIERIEGLPGVEAAGAIGEFFLGINPDHSVDIEGRPLDISEQRQLSRDPVTPGFFESLGTPLLAGRFFEAGDRAGSLPVAIVNKAMADHYWPGENAIGKRFRGAATAEVPWLTVVGVVGDMRRQAPDRAPVLQYFQPLAQRPRQYMILMVRGEIGSSGFVASIRDAVAEVEPSAPLYSIAPLSSKLEQRIAERRFQSWLLGLFSIAAVLLAAIGIFGLTQFAVSQRTREIGIRMVLGARGQDVATRMALRGVAPAAAGVLIGLAGALAASRLMQSLLYQTSPSDPLTYAGTACLLLTVAAVGCYLPARRAARVDPVSALRQE